MARQTQQRSQKSKNLCTFTEAMIEKLKPPSVGKDAKGNPCGSIDYYDRYLPGLILRVNYGGAKVWRVRYYVTVTKQRKGDTEPRKYTEQRLRKLGRYPSLKLQQARAAASPFLIDHKKALKEAAAEDQAETFKQVAENFIKRHVEKSKLRSQPEIERCLAKYIYPRWQHRPFLELKRRDVALLLDQIQDQNGARQADVCLAIISKMMNWYQTRDDDYANPVVRGMRRVKPGDGKRKRILNDDEIRAVWEASAGSTFGAILKVLLLTAQRREKVATMKWDDLKDGVWTIPQERREKSTAGALKLPKLALDIIQAQPRIAGNPYVFASSRQGRRPSKEGPPAFNSFSQRKVELDEKLPKDIPPWVIHDLRRTAKSLMVRAGVRPDISERVLGHVIAGVEGVYDQHPYDDEKADALNRLASLVDSILNPRKGNVVAISDGASRSKKKVRPLRSRARP